MRIALSGSHGVGKSTLLAAVNLPGHKKIEEVARRQISRCGQLPHQMTPKEFAQFQLAIAREQLAAESGDFIADRTVYDSLVYAMDAPNYQEIEALVLAAARPYDYIFYLPIEFTMPLDEVRKADVAYQQLIDQRLRALYQRLAIDYCELSGSLDKRLKQIEQSLRALAK